MDTHLLRRAVEDVNRVAEKASSNSELEEGGQCLVRAPPEA